MSTAPSPERRVAADLELQPDRVVAVARLLDEGSTVPFIARYRKEATGGTDDETLARIADRLSFHRDLDERRGRVLASIEEQGGLDDELRQRVEAATTRVELEDLYLPYRPKRRTRATMGRDRGLEPLADRMWEQWDCSGRVEDVAREFVDLDRGVPSVADALRGARDIVAERVTEIAELRERIRRLTREKGRIESKAARGMKKVSSKFSDYYDHVEAVARIPSHRTLALLRGEAEGFLRLKILPDPETAKRSMRQAVISRTDSIWRGQLQKAVDDAYDRLLSGQIETEIRAELKARADEDAIAVFASNLRDLLMAPPFGERMVLAIDPGMRTGCKVVILGPTGALLDHGVIFPTAPGRDIAGTRRALDRWLGQHERIAAVAIGNGTGGRETLAVVQEHLRSRGRRLPVVLVNEAGASVYSASELARREMPDQDVTVRGAVSIGRRLQDPLAELVKIDPRSIGVGQYQHDVDGKRLQSSLEAVVVQCVNQVGVDVNTASSALLRHVSGLNARLAEALVEYRESRGRIASREELKEVRGLGRRTFELAAGFLRVRGGAPLDDSAVHPERYALVRRMAHDVGRDLPELIGNASAVASLDVQRYVDDDVGLYTLRDILAELEKPGRDPRDSFEVMEFRDDVHEIGDLRENMVLPGVVTNVTHFGAFVDVGVHQDGLVHVSQIADRYVKDPSEELRVGQTVRVRVMEIDLERGRIGLSIKAV